MKEFYVFKVNSNFYKLYKEKQSELFSIYNRIYKMKKSDKEYGYNLFCQISEFLNKNEINEKIKRSYSKEIMYTYNDNEHIINNIFLNEISIMTVKNSCIKIETNVNNSSFFNDFKKLNGYYFICDFKGLDYFFVTKRKVNV